MELWTVACIRPMRLQGSFRAISPIGLAELFRVSSNGPGKGLRPRLES